MGPKEQKTKEQKAKAAMSSSKGKKKKWSKGKVKEKANNAVLLDKATLEKLHAEVPKYKMITPSILVDRMRVNGSLARYCIKMLWDEGKIKPVSKDHAQWIFTRDTSAWYMAGICAFLSFTLTRSRANAASSAPLRMAAAVRKAHAVSLHRNGSAPSISRAHS